MAIKKYFRLSNYKHPKLVITLLALAVLVIVTGILELTDTTYIFHKQKIETVVPVKDTSSSSSSQSTPADTTSQPSTQPSQTPSDKSSASTPTPNSSTPLIVPYGTFVSNHKPGQNGSTSDEQSVCNTTPGATCSIKFTQDNIVKSLPTQTTDSNGATYWLWDIKQAGLTSGTWEITAVSNLNGQSKTAQDPLALEIQ